MKEPIRVMIVDDHEVVRLGLRTALDIEDALDVVAEAGSGAAAMQLCASLRPDVVLLDVVMPDMDGIETCRELLSSDHAPRVVMLTSYDNDQAVAASVMAGTSGFLLKNVGRGDIVRAILEVAAGARLIDPAVERRVAEGLVRRSDDGLTEREREIIALVAQGKTNKEIAADLIISEKTARNHVSRILEKLDLTNRSQAAAWFVKREPSA